MTNFALYFGGALFLNCLITLQSLGFLGTFTATDISIAENEDVFHKRRWENLLKRYLTVYLLATMAEFIHGAYIYASYSKYGYTKHEIAILVVSAYLSSIFVGSFVGSMADWGGRRRFGIIYTILYGAYCISMHFNNFWVLLAGRISHGVGVSLLFSVYDSWLIHAHLDAGLHHYYLQRSFSWASYGNFGMAIIAGLIANVAADIFPTSPVYGDFFHVGGDLAPFDVAIVLLLMCAVNALLLLEENYGEPRNSTTAWYGGVKKGCLTVSQDLDVFLCGIITSLFESSISIFAFNWTPALTDGTNQDLPFGLIFSTFMVCCMGGSCLISMLNDRFRDEHLALFVFAGASISMAFTALATKRETMFLAMNIYEVFCGSYWPVMGPMKASIVPEYDRAAVYSLYRIPLNFIAVSVLLTNLTMAQSFALNCAMLLTAFLLQIILTIRRTRAPRDMDLSSETLALIA